MTIEHFDFQSQEPEAPDGFAGYHQLYSYGTDVDRGAGPFGASVTAFRFRHLLVFDRRLSGMSHTRTTRRVRQDGFDHIHMQLLLAGEMVGGPPEGPRAVKPGEIIVFDTSRPQHTALRHARMIALSLPRDYLEQRLSLPASLHGTILPGTVGGLLAGFLRSLVRQAGTLAPQATEHAGTVVATLAASALGGVPDAPSALRGEGAVQFRLDRIMGHMSDHLSDHELDAAATAAALGLSRSTLDRALGPAGGFGAVLSKMRLDRMRAVLRRADRTLTVGAVAHGVGFRSLSHCSRSFRARFGLPPQQWRERQNGGRHEDAPAGGAMGRLFQELR